MFYVRRSFRKKTSNGFISISNFSKLHLIFLISPSRVDEDSFETYPQWDRGEQCYCINASNGTFFCLRHLFEEANGDMENYLYCEFITGEQEFYDLHTDPNAELNLWNFVSKFIVHLIAIKILRMRTRSPTTYLLKASLENSRN
jgi:hypothetical protein